MAIALPFILVEFALYETLTFKLANQDLENFRSGLELEFPSVVERRVTWRSSGAWAVLNRVLVQVTKVISKIICTGLWSSFEICCNVLSWPFVASSMTIEVLSLDFSHKSHSC